jgi:hypothetical protein
MVTDDQEFETFTLNLGDPKLRDLIAAHPNMVAVMELQRCLFRSIDHLDPGPEAFQDYIRETVGGPYSTHKFRTSGLSYYFNNDLQFTDDQAQFNQAATTLLADESKQPLAEGVLVYGTVLITGFDFDTWMPRPLPHGQLVAAFDRMVQNEQHAGDR